MITVSIWMGVVVLLGMFKLNERLDRYERRVLLCLYFGAAILATYAVNAS